jgi:hypothetical protein
MYEYDEKHVACDGKCIAVSEKAILVDIDGTEVWIPQSQVHEDSEVFAKGDDGKLVITKWIARQKGVWDE